MKKTFVLLVIAAILTASMPTVADEKPTATSDSCHAITGTILSVGYATGDILVYQDSGSILALYGLDRATLRDIGAGDRVAVTFGENFKVAAIERLDL